MDGTVKYETCILYTYNIKHIKQYECTIRKTFSKINKNKSRYYIETYNRCKNRYLYKNSFKTGVIEIVRFEINRHI